jgi:hypothetical protein
LGSGPDFLLLISPVYTYTGYTAHLYLLVFGRIFLLLEVWGSSMSFFSRVAGWFHKKESKEDKLKERVLAFIDPYRGGDEEYSHWLAEEVQKFSQLAKEELLLVLRKTEPSRELLMGASLHKEATVRNLAATHQLMPSDCLLRLASDSEETVRAAVVANQNTPGEALTLLAHPQNKHLFPALARHPNTPSEVLPTLRQEGNTTLDYFISKNPNVTMSLLDIFSQSSDRMVRDSAVFHRTLHQHRMQRLSSPDLTIDELVRFAEDPNNEVRLRVAMHAQSSAQVLTRLSVDLQLQVRQAVGKHPRTPPEILEKLSRDRSPVVRESILSNSNTQEGALQVVYDKIKTPSRAFQLALLGNPNTPIGILKEYTESRVEPYRLLVARHPKVTSELLALLLTDRSVSVKKAAQDNLVARNK